MRDVIFVIGMHRSGTSAFARTLSLCGAALPLRIMPANHANPSGYWEPQRAVDLNDLFLRARASSWSDARFAFAADPRSSAFDEGFVSLIADFFETGFEDGGPMMLKDPRVTGLLPYWTAGARRHRLRVKVVHVYRHPLDVASSLAERDGLVLDHALALWLKLNLLGELDASAYRRIFVSYEELMRDWYAVITRCAGQLDIDIKIDREAESGISAFLSPQLRHHNAELRNGSDIAASPALELVFRLHGVLERAAHGDVDTAALDAIRADAGAFAVQ